MENDKDGMLKAIDLLLKHRSPAVPVEVYDETLATIRRLIRYHGQKFATIDQMARLYESGAPV